MNNLLVRQLDEEVNALLAGHLAPPTSDPQLRQLLQIAGQLRDLPRPEFCAQLRRNLRAAGERQTNSLAEGGCMERMQRVEEASPVAGGRAQSLDRHRLIAPRFRCGTAALPIRGSHLAISFGLHVVALALVMASGWWMVENGSAVRAKVAQLIPGSEVYILPAAPGEIRGGGGGGDHDKMSASHGTPPRFASEQLTPPTVVVRNEIPRLPTEPTVVGPPDLQLPKSAVVGDPVSSILAPLSNGIGRGSGIGSGSGGGVGSGFGVGVGDGRGGGMGGGVFRVGGGVSAPRAIYDPDPEYSTEARKAKYQGSVLLWAIVDADGRPRDLHIVRSLGMGLDEKALEAVRQWRFDPAKKDGHPVAVQINIEVAFRLY